MDRLLVLACAGAALLLFHALSTLAYNAFFHPLRKYPGPLSWTTSRVPFCISVLRGRIPFDVNNLHQKYGPVVRIAPNQLSYAEPQAWKDIMGHHGHKMAEMSKYKPYYLPVEGLPSHIISSDRAEHAALRKVFSHGFSDKAMREQEPIIKDYMNLFFDRLTEKTKSGDSKTDMTTYFNLLFFDVIGKLAFGEDFNGLKSSQTSPSVSMFFESAKVTTRYYMGSYFPTIHKLMLKLRPISSEELQKHIQLYTGNIQKLRKRMASTERQPDLIQCLLDSKEKLELDIVKLEANSSVLVAAGSETTATTMSGATYLLLSNPDCLEKLKTEVRGRFQTEDEIDFSSCNDLPYLRACIEETLRFYPAIPGGLPRQVPKGGAFVSGEFVPEDTIVEIHQYSMSRAAHNWALADEFHPERFLDDPRFVNDKKEAFQPFYVGPRACLGRHLAELEMRCVLARLVWKFDMQIADDSRDWIEPQLVFDIWQRGVLNVHLKLAH